MVKITYDKWENVIRENERKRTPIVDCYRLQMKIQGAILILFLLGDCRNMTIEMQRLLSVECRKNQFLPMELVNISPCKIITHSDLIRFLDVTVILSTVPGSISYVFNLHPSCVRKNT